MARVKYYAFECQDNSYSGKLFQFKSMEEARKKAADLAAERHAGGGLMRIARYKKSSPGKPERVKYSITEISPEEWHELVIAMGGLYSGLAIEMHKQMQAVDNAPDLDADGGKWSE